MVKLDDAHIALSKVTGTIYITEFRKDGTTKDGKVDRKNEFIATMIEYLKLYPDGLKIDAPNGKTYSITMNEEKTDKQR